MATRRYTISILIKTSGSKRAKRDIGELGGAAGKAAQGVDLVKAGMAGLGAAGVIGGALIAKRAVSGIVSELLEYGTATEVLKARLETVEGSQAKANARFKQLADFSASTPFQLEGVTNAYIRLQNVGIEATEQRLQAFGDTAAANGRSLEDYASAVSSATVGEMDALKSFGILASQEKDKVTFTFKGMKTEVGRNSDEIVEYLTSLGETNFSGGMELQSKTVVGLTSTIKDQYAQMVSGIYEAGFDDVVKGVLTEVSEALTFLLKHQDKIQAGFSEGFGIMGGAALRFGEITTGIYASVTSGTASVLGVLGRVVPSFKKLAEGIEESSDLAETAKEKMQDWRGELESWRSRKLVDIFTDQADGADDLKKNASGATTTVAALANEVQRLTAQGAAIDRLAVRIAELQDLANRGLEVTPTEDAFFELIGPRRDAISDELGEDRYKQLVENIAANFEDEMSKAAKSSKREMLKHYTKGAQEIGDITERELEDAVDRSADHWESAWGGVVRSLSGLIDNMLAAASEEVQLLAGVISGVAQGYADYKEGGGTGGFSDFFSQGSGGGGYGDVVSAVGGYYINDTFAGGGQGKYGGELSGTYSQEGQQIGGAFGGVWGFYGAAIGAFIKKGADEATARLAGLGTDEFFSEVSADTPGLEQTISALTATISETFGNAVRAAGGKVLSSPEIGLTIRDDLITVMVNGAEYQAASIQDAVYFALVTAFNESEISGVAPEVLQAMTSNLRRTADEWVQDVQMTQAIIDYNLGQTTIAARDTGSGLDQMRERLVALGVDMGEFNMFAAAEWQNMRDSILGTEESFEEKIKRQQEEFNAERARQYEAYEEELAALVEQLVEAVGTDELKSMFADAGVQFGEVTSLASEDLLRLAGAVTTFGGISGATAEEVQAKIDALRGALESLPDAISDEEVDAAIDGRGGARRGGGRNIREEIAEWREAVSRLGEDLGPVSSQLEQIADSYNAEIERGLRLKQSIDDLVAARDAELERVRDDSWGDFVKDWIVWTHSLGPYEQQRIAAGEEADRMRERLRDLGAAGAVAADVMEDLLQTAGEEAWRHANAWVQDFTNGFLLQIYGYLGDTEAAAELQWELSKAELEAKREQLRIALADGHLTQEAFDRISGLVDQVIAAGPAASGAYAAANDFMNSFLVQLYGYLGDSEAAAALQWEFTKAELEAKREQLKIALIAGHLTQEAYDRISDLVDQVIANGPPVVAPPLANDGGGGGGGGGPSGPSIADLARDYRRELERAASAGFGSLNELRARFQELFDERPYFVALDEWQESLDLAVDAFRERLLEPIRQLRDDILTDPNGGLSGRDQFDAARDAFQDIAARISAGDVSALEELPGIAAAYRNAGRDYIGNSALGPLEQQILALLDLAENLEIDAGVAGGQVFVNGVPPTGSGPLGSSAFDAGVSALQASYERVGNDNLAELRATRNEIRGLRDDLIDHFSDLTLERAS